MNFRDQGFTLDTPPTNVIAFPGTRRGCLAPIAETRQPTPRRNTRPAAIAGAELNARLLMLLGICITGAVIALSAVRILQG
jgi:hypothetical protein